MGIRGAVLLFALQQLLPLSLAATHPHSNAIHSTHDKAGSGGKPAPVSEDITMHTSQQHQQRHAGLNQRQDSVNATTTTTVFGCTVVDVSGTSATLHDAQVLARTAMSGGAPCVDVHLGSRMYSLAEPLVLTQADSNTVNQSFQSTPHTPRQSGRHSIAPLTTPVSDLATLQPVRQHHVHLSTRRSSPLTPTYPFTLQSYPTHLFALHTTTTHTLV
jgi:hypothetical protein